MRRLKFRAWETIGREMHSFDTLMRTIYAETNMNIFNDDSIILMQYTGLKDENGKEIYDGDILQFRNASGMDDSICHVVWNEDRFSWFIENDESNIYDELYNITAPADIKIIGNKYENPELLNSESAPKNSVQQPHYATDES